MQIRSGLRIGMTLLALFVSGCFKVDIENGVLQCVLNGGKCPSGYFCASDGKCWKEGTGPGSNVDLAGADLAGADLVSVGNDAGGGSDAGSGGDGGGTKTAGEACGDASECATGFCVDGYCCNTECSGSCVACNLTGFHGSCTVLADSESPRAGHPSCGPDGKDTCKRDGACDGQGACRFWDTTTICKASSCDPGQNKATVTAKCDGAGTCVLPNAITCEPFTCNAANTDCRSTCSIDGECASPATCAGMSCGTKANGSSCTAGTQCTSGNCVDGVCCNTACGDKCMACDLPATLGTCTAVTSGQPHGTRGACANSGTTCGGACAAASTTSCTYPTSTTTCGLSTCTSGTQMSAGQCNGAGICAAGGTVSCGNYVCNTGGTACNTTCTSDTQCAASRYCNTDSTCKTTKPNGRTCSMGTECTSGNCIDGYCCNVACGDSCAACNLTGSLGTCKAIASGAAPVSPRAACAGSGACKGACNGTATTCQYPGSSTGCGGGTCTRGSSTAEGSQVPLQTCNGAGACSAAQAAVTCGSYQCNPSNTACLTSCATNADCTYLKAYNAPATCDAGGHCACFAAGTAVQTPDGARAIETFGAGDDVLAFDVREGKLVTKKVVALEIKHAPSLVRLAFGGETITTTPDHYFWVDGVQWVRAIELRVGDAMRMPTGQIARLATVESLPLPLDGDDRVYNLLVEDVETYFVGTSPILTHSCTTLSFSAHARN